MSLLGGLRRPSPENHTKVHLPWRISCKSAFAVGDFLPKFVCRGGFPAKIRLPWGIHAKLSFVWHTKREKLGFRLVKREKA
jgi:hypothetical protein